MTATIVHTVKCPICQSNGEMIHHDVRAPLVYSCRNCSHEWEIKPADEPAEGDPTVERARVPSAVTKRPRKR